MSHQSFKKAVTLKNKIMFGMYIFFQHLFNKMILPS